MGPSMVPTRLTNSPGLITSPGWDLMRSCLLSRWVRINWKPQSASVSVKVCSTNRSSPFRLNLRCSFCCRTKTISPVTVSGCKRKTIAVKPETKQSFALSTIIYSLCPHLVCTSNFLRDMQLMHQSSNSKVLFPTLPPFPLPNILIASYKVKFWNYKHLSSDF